MNVRPNAIVKEKVRHRHVRNIRLDITTATSRHLKRQAANYPKNDRDVVGRKAPKNVLFTSDFAKAQAIRIDVTHLAQGATPDQLQQLSDPGVILQDVTNH